MNRKSTKSGNLFTKLRRDSTIVNSGTRAQPCLKLVPGVDEKQGSTCNKDDRKGNNAEGPELA